MSLLKQLLMDKKIFEAQEEIDQFIEDQGIEDGNVPQRLEFDKEIFAQKEQVDEFLQTHLFASMKIEEDDKKYSAIIFDEVGFIKETMKEVEIREGVMIVVGLLRPMSNDNPFLYSISEETMKLSADLPYIIELAKVVDGFHPAYGQVKITKKDLRSFKDNFDKRVYGIDISLDFDHETREAAGWLKEVFLSDDEQTLLGVVTWTPKGALSLSEREFRYFSPEFSLNWVHPHTGVNHGPTLIGGALVNRPFLKMDAIVGLNEKEKGAKEMETISLSDHKAQIGSLEKDIADLRLSENTLKTTNKGLKEENVKLSEELKTLKEEIALKEKQAKHQKLFDEGKINKAQLDALNEGKDLLDVLSLSEAMNTKPAGSGAAAEQVQLTDEERALCIKMGISEEDFIKFNKEAQ